MDKEALEILDRALLPWEQYLLLIREVAEIDLGAATYLLFDAHKVKGWEPAGSLNGVFIWKKTPQGHDYWAAINSKMVSTS